MAAEALEKSAQRGACVGVHWDHLHRQRQCGGENSFHLVERPFLFHLIDKNPLKPPRHRRWGEEQDDDGEDKTPGNRVYTLRVDLLTSQSAELYPFPPWVLFNSFGFRIIIFLSFTVRWFIWFYFSFITLCCLIDFDGTVCINEQHIQGVV